MELNYQDIHGESIEVGDLILRDGFYVELVEYDKGAYLLSWIDPRDGQTEHKGLFYDNWATYKSQGLEIIAKGVL